MDKKKLRLQAERLQADIADTVNAADPMGLLALGAPCDEYEQEIQQIAAGLCKCQTVSDVQELIHRVFRENFGADADLEEPLYREMAERIPPATRSP